MQRSAQQQRPDNSGKTSVLSVLSLLESLTLAILLAFIFRGFVVEAFVIPTGSMAQTLLGEHGETICRDCRHRFSTGVLPPGRPRGPTARNRKPYCPNCGALAQQAIRRRAGDRVLVLKPTYFLSRYRGLEFLAPKRWDVPVFLYPGSGQDNYIKRLVGLPGETIEVVAGDVYINGKIAHKPTEVQERMWIAVFDNDYQPQRDRLDGPLWQGAGEENVERLGQGRIIRLKAKEHVQSVVYRGSANNSLNYNALRSNAPTLTSRANIPVSDLQLSFDVIGRETRQSSEVMAELSKGRRYFRLRLRLSKPKAVLELQSRHAEQATSGPGLWKTMQDEQGLPLRLELQCPALGEAMHLQIQNVDYRISIWVDGKKVLSSTDGNYHHPPLEELRELAKKREPRAYIAITAKDCEVDLLHIKLQRDVYYTQAGPILLGSDERQRADAVAMKLRGKAAHACGKPFQIPSETSKSGPGYFMMGDNSSDSRDSRLWLVKHAGLNDNYVRGSVPQSHLIGQAFFVYWPGAGDLLGNQLPIVPRVGQMRLIH